MYGVNYFKWNKRNMMKQKYECHGTDSILGQEYKYHEDNMNSNKML